MVPNNSIKDNIMVVGNFYPNKSSQAFLNKFIKIIYPLSDNLTLISGDTLDIKYKNLSFTSTLVYNSPSPFIKRGFFYLLNQITISISIVKVYFSQKIDVIFFLSSPIIPILIAKILRIKMVRYQGGSFSHQLNGSIGGLKRKILILIFEIIPNYLFDFISVEAKSSIKFQNLEKYSKKVVIAPQSVDNIQFSFKESKIAPPTQIGFIGGLNINKGACNFCEGVILLREYINKNDLSIGIWGSGDLLNILENRIEDAGLSRYVTFYGEVFHNEIPDVLHSLGLLVVPSFSEGVPNIILEAMACGTLVLATPVGGIPDIIIDEKTGFIMENNSPITIRNNILRVYENHNHISILEAAHHHILQSHTFEIVQSRYKELLNRLC